MTAGCSIEVEEFQIYLTGFKKIRFTIIGCSKDSINKNIKFAKKYHLKYLLRSDLDNVCEKLNIWLERSMYGKKYYRIDRSTYMIDSNGKIFNQWNKVKVKNHVKEVFELANQYP